MVTQRILQGKKWMPLSGVKMLDRKIGSCQPLPSFTPSQPPPGTSGVCWPRTCMSSCAHWQVVNEPQPASPPLPLAVFSAHPRLWLAADGHDVLRAPVENLIARTVTHDVMKVSPEVCHP